MRHAIVVAWNAGELLQPTHRCGHSPGVAHAGRPSERSCVGPPNGLHPDFRAQGCGDPRTLSMNRARPKISAAFPTFRDLLHLPGGPSRS